MKVFNKKHRAFTIVELVIMAPIVMLVIGAFIAVIVDMASQAAISRMQTQMVYDVQDGLSRMENDIKTSVTFLATNSVTLSSPQGYNDDTTNFINVNNGATGDYALIIKAIATDKNPLDSTAKPIYLTNTPNACSSANVALNTPMTYNIVYFIKNSSLWRRILMPSNYLTAGCSTPFQVPSCAIGQTGSMCKTEDVNVIPNVTIANFNLNYYTVASSTTADAISVTSTNSDSLRGMNLLTLPTVQIDVTSSKTIAGKTAIKSGSLRVTIIKYSAF